MIVFELGTPRDTAWSDWRSRKDQRETLAMLATLGATICPCGATVRKKDRRQKFCSARCRRRSRSSYVSNKQMRAIRKRNAKAAGWRA